MSKNMSIERIYSKANFYLFTVLLFFTPLIFTTNTNELFEFPKMLFIYFLGSIIIFLFALKTVFTWSKVILPNSIILAFIAGNVVSTVFSSNLYTSIWGYYTRFNGGLISTLIFAGLYTVAINELKKNDIKKIVQISLINLVPISFYGISQHYKLVGNIWGANPAERVFSTFGQPNWLAAYITMIIPVILLFVLHSARKSKILWSATYILAFSTLWFTYSMSGLLGLLAGIVFFMVYNQKLMNKANKKYLMALFFISLLTAGLNLGIFKSRLQDTIIDIKNFISIEKPVLALEPETETYTISDPGYIRKYLWKGTLNLILSNPKILMTGTGPETFPYEFQKYRETQLNYSSEWDFVFNKPHNYYLEICSNLGLISLAPYILLISISIKKKNKFFTPGLTAFYVTNFFGWPTAATALLFWIFLAGIELDKIKNE